MVSPARARVLAAVGAACIGVAGCATPPPASDPDAVADFKATNDPFEPANRFFYRLSDGVLVYVLTPAARGYNAALPRPARNGIHNMLNNLGQPVQFVNDVLETKPRRAGDSFMRFTINSTLGVGGIFDVARRIGYPDHDSDGGSTLALWGVPPGPYLYLPVYGPSGVRDGIGRGLDAASNPLTWVSFNGSNTLSFAQGGLGAVDFTARHLRDIRQVKAGALDPYATFRSLYRQLRETQVNAIRNDHRATVPDWYPQAGSNGAPLRTAPGPKATPELTPRPVPTAGAAPASPG